MNQRLRNLKDAGYTIHLEGVGKGVPSGDSEKFGVEVLRNIMALSRDIGIQTGLVYQKDALNAEGFVNRDITDVEIVRHVNPRTLRLLAQIPLDEVKVSPARTVSALRRVGRLSGLMCFFPVLGSLFRAILIPRNKFAVYSALATSGDVALFWGAAHLPGMTRLLKREGFRVVDSSWWLAIPADHKVPEKALTDLPQTV